MNQIKNDHRLLKLIQKQFSNKKQREARKQVKNRHLVYDAGDNQLRVSYLEQGGKIYVFKVFNSHDNYENYLNSTPLLVTLCVKKKTMMEYKLIKEV
ncbi:MAG: hypothetical protein ABIM31_06330 [candidate division WOR-3 bacterium]